MPFISENRLEEMLVKAVQSPQAAPEFYRLLLDSDLLVLGAAHGHEDARQTFSLPPGSQLSLVPGERNGEKFLPVFSSPARIQDYVKDESKYLAVRGRDLFELTRGAPVVLNPASEYGKELTPDQVAQLLHDVATMPRRAESEIDPPRGLIEMLTAVFQTRPDVSTAWILQLTFSGRDGGSHPLVGVETAGDMKSLIAQIESAAGVRLPGLMFDVQRVDRARPEGMTDAFLQITPFYQRAASSASTDL